MTSWGVAERNLTHKFLVFVRPEFFPVQPIEHHGEAVDSRRRRAAPSPPGVGKRGLLHQAHEFRRCGDMGFERRQIVQIAG
jgi:hypothetical protein